MRLNFFVWFLCRKKAISSKNRITRKHRYVYDKSEHNLQVVAYLLDSYYTRTVMTPLVRISIDVKARSSINK